MHQKHTSSRIKENKTWKPIIDSLPSCLPRAYTTMVAVLNNNGHCNHRNSNCAVTQCVRTVATATVTFATTNATDPTSVQFVLAAVAASPAARPGWSSTTRTRLELVRITENIAKQNKDLRKNMVVINSQFQGFEALLRRST